MSMKLKLLFWLMLAAVLLPAPDVSAGTCTFDITNLSLKTSFGCVTNIRNKSGIKEAEPVAIVVTLLRVALSLAAIIGVIAVVIAGFTYVTAGGDERKAEKGKHGLLYAIIGLIVIGISVAIVNLVVNTLQGK